jgi:hypothetical protein
MDVTSLAICGFIVGVAYVAFITWLLVRGEEGK